MKTRLLLSLILATAFSFAQTFDIQFETSWDDDREICVPCDYIAPTGEVYTTITKPINIRGKADFSYSIASVKYITVDFPAQYDKKVLPGSPEIEIAFGKAGAENFINAYYNPLIYRAGKVEMIESITVSVDANSVSDEFDRDFEFASSSVLASGEWYKIGIQADGIQKLTYSDLSELGISVGSINPNHINIYGNHTPELPIDNSVERQDDLVKNAIFIQGGGDGSFDEGDYILFYGKGPQVVQQSSFEFLPRKNKIDSLNYMFIHIDASDSPSRIGTVNSTDIPFTNVVNSFTSYALHENNEENLLKSGDGWYGKHFEGSNLTYSFTLGVENRDVSEPVTLETHYVVASKSGSSGLKVNINGVEVDDIPAGTLEGSYVVATAESNELDFTSGTSSFNVDLTFYRSSAASEAWLDYMRFQFIKQLRMGVNQMIVHDLRTVGPGAVNQFNISNADGNTKVWEITKPI